jgi:hypothetical protein
LAMSDHHQAKIRDVAIPSILLLVGVAALAALGLRALLCLGPSPPPGYAKVQTGMSQPEVEAILGTSTGQSYIWVNPVEGRPVAKQVIQAEQWVDSDFIVHVQYDALTGVVTHKRLIPLGLAQGVLFQLRDNVPGLQETDQSLGSQEPESKESGLNIVEKPWRATETQWR